MMNKMKQMKANLYKSDTSGCTTGNTAMCRNGGPNSGAKDGDGTTEKSDMGENNVKEDKSERILTIFSARRINVGAW